MPGLTVRPGPVSGMGATIETTNLDNLSDNDFQELREALYRHNVICIKQQKGFSSRAQADLTRRFDPKATSYGHGKTIDAKRSILHPDLKTVPAHPEVQIIGNGHIAEYEGLHDFKLKHPHHRTFHKSAIPDELDLDYTRFYRWHIDAALFGSLNPPLVTSLFAEKVPAGRTQTALYDDDSDQSLQVPLGTTAFVSSYTMFDLLSPAQKAFALGTKVEYAPHPYVWISTAKSRQNGLGMVSEGLETPVSDLPAYEESDVQILPMVWQNPVTGQLALQIHPSPVRKLYCADGRVVDDLEEVRRIVYELQRPGIAPEHVYAHDWEEGDLVLFNNHGVLHSVVGAFREDEVRLFRQCNLAASKPPMGPEALA
ncbi:putative dioxygenase [Cyphellophora attinorum]|uniref:Putative dioxygenase n=1 Tax=Cyphellophora attinorum TaxID=1664694 RepID=A0A0N1GY47_9EURO|nr:putative dioxygenase [Phialophora attinorum]KPI35455.1 putative dioxygenase [Phialophora attinorum]